MKAQSQCNFNPALVQAINVLAEIAPKTSKKIARFTGKGMHPQVVITSELQKMLKIEVKRPRLEYLQLGIQRPKALPTFEPLIDDEFVLTDRELKLKKGTEETPKEMKRKIKEQEKHAARELRKDTQIVMQEKKNQASQRDKKYKTSIYRGGNKPTDEV